MLSTLIFPQGNLLLTMKRPEAAAGAFRVAQELRPDIRSYQGLIFPGKSLIHCTIFIVISKSSK